MKVFDSSPGLTIEQPRRRWIAVALAIASATCIALGGGLFYQHTSYQSQLQKANQDLATAQANAAELQTKLTSMTGKLDAAGSTVNSCTSNLAAETSKVAAFAKQAAACEVIRQKLHLKG